jgi:hypothetical protein
MFRHLFYGDGPSDCPTCAKAVWDRGYATNWLRRRSVSSVGSIMWHMARMGAFAIAASGCVLVVACSSTQRSTVPGPVPVSTSSSGNAVQQYLNGVNALCDGLEQKVIALNGGQFDIPLKDFLAQLPQHTKLRDDFDRQLAAIVVPQVAATNARAVADYVVFADKLDSARLRAARQGAAAYQREIQAEQKSAASDPSIAALDAAGFSDSCTAR